MVYLRPPELRLRKNTRLSDIILKWVRHSLNHTFTSSFWYSKWFEEAFLVRSLGGRLVSRDAHTPSPLTHAIAILMTRGLHTSHMDLNNLWLVL